jgi:hypothetical protein
MNYNDMRKLALSLAIIVLLAVLFYFTLNNSPTMDLGSERAVNRVLGQASKTIEKKYGLRCCGSGAAMPGGIVKGLTLSFDTLHVISKDQFTSNEFINK